MLLMFCDLYYKPVTIVNDDSRIINKFGTSHTDNARVIIYDRHMFIVQATGFEKIFKTFYACNLKMFLIS